MRLHVPALVVLLALSAPSTGAQEGRGTAPAPAPPPLAEQALVDPPLLRNLSHKPATVEVVLTASPKRLALAPGKVTEAYTFNGSVPGPTLELYEGDHVIVHFRNELPEATTIHWHGLHIPAVMDGSPLHPVAPGASYDYVFTIKPGTAGTYWYHPHPDVRSGYQIAKGLFGAVIVRARDDPLRGLPERLLILSDNRFRADGSVEFADPSSVQGQIDEVNGREGDVLFVNGQLAPTVRLRSGEVQRWRVINVAAARVYRLALAGHTLLHVGSDGGLFERPVEVREIEVANSERVELLVRGTGAPGDRVALQTLPYDRYVPQTRPRDWQVARHVLSVVYPTEPPLVAPAVPATLRHVEPLDSAAATAKHVIVLSQGLINGRMMDMHRVDVRGTLGATEIWEIENVVGMDHPFHLHGFQFQVLERGGKAEPFPSWKDVVNVRKHESVRIIVRYDDYPGMWMFHCHILDHEDHGMMGILEVRSPPPRKGS